VRGRHETAHLEPGIWARAELDGAGEGGKPLAHAGEAMAERQLLGAVAVVVGVNRDAVRTELQLDPQMARVRVAGGVGDDFRQPRFVRRL